MNHELTIIYEFDSATATGIWELISGLLIERGLQDGEYLMYDEAFPFDKISRAVELYGKSSFKIRGGGLEFSFTHVRPYRHDAVRVVSAGGTYWADWVEKLRVGGGFVQAFVVDECYNFWQNAKDPMIYIAENKPYQHLPMKSNGLPYPLDKLIIDTSGNPGRMVFHRVYIEAVGSPMWLGRRFWELTGANKNSLFAIPDVEVHDEDGLTVVTSKDQPFTDATDRQLLDALRGALYPTRNE